MRKKAFRFSWMMGCVGAVVALAAPVAVSARGQEGPADLILTNGKVYTVDAAHPWAEAVAIRGGRILAVGSAKAVARRKGARTEVVDLGGRMVVPGFGDAHAHPMFGGLTHARCPITDGKTPEQYAALIAACVAKKPGDGVVYGIGWAQTNFPGISPRKETLDAISKDRPILFGSFDGHAMWANSKALELAGITRDTPDPLGGTIGRDANGEPNGAIWELSGIALFDKLIPPPTPAELQASIRYVVHHFNSLGITQWHDAGVEFNDDGTSPMVEAYRAVRDAGQLTAHVAIDLKWKNERGLDQIPAIIAASKRAEGYGLNAHSVKFYLDGVLPQHTAAMLQPYVGTNERGKPAVTPATLAAAVTQLDAQGIQMHTHSEGDAAVRESLDAVAAARAKNGRSDTRPMISHMNVIDPADQPRFGQLGVYAVFQPYWASNYDDMDLQKKAIGPERASNIYPAANVVKGGGKMAYGSDWPVDSAYPLDGMQVALTRTNPLEPQRGALLPDQAVTLKEALASYTLHVAEADHFDKDTGSIVAGKQADLVVLDRNIFELAPDAIAATKVVLTMFEGKPVYGGLGALKAPERGD
ncbi:amidohydrolase [Novosphingobium resinovorum]|uniref:amidohydrolase n=1 Tax=Novosphingobium resinovorum TaxID=158500 RepID=UPI002ED64394|nr:amidohydrolase [Novosphingobium resinovorum]